MNAAQQPAARHARRHIGVDGQRFAFPGEAIVIVRDVEARVNFPELIGRFATDAIRHPREGKQVALIGRVDENLGRAIQPVPRAEAAQAVALAPRNYDAGRYEILARWIEAIQDTDPSAVLTMLNFMSASFLPQGKYDVNNRGPFSTDLYGENWAYADAGFDYATNRTINYALREQIWQDQIDYQMGFFWWLQDPANSRCPASVRDSFRQHWLCLDEYNEVWPGDPPGWSSQYYVREARRMVSDVVLTEQDVRRQSGAAWPWADSIIGCASYSMDSHNKNRILQEYAPGQFRVWNEGGIHVLAGGTNSMIPLPYEILRPRNASR